MAKKTEDKVDDTTKKEEVKVKKPEGIFVMRPVKIHYSNEEVTVMGRQMSYAHQEAERIKEEAKEAAAAYKNQVVAKETEVKNYRNSINLGFQMMTVNCELIKNFDEQRREYWYGGKIVDTEPLSPKDHQLTLEMAEEANSKEEQRLKEEAKGETKTTGKEPVKEEVKPVELTEELKVQLKDFIKLGDAAYKKKNYKEALQYFQAAFKIDSQNPELKTKVENTEKFLQLVANADAERKKKDDENMGENPLTKKDELPVHNENHPLHDSRTLKDYAKAMVAGDDFVSKKKWKEAEISYRKAHNLAPDKEDAKAKLEEVKVKVDRLIAANAIQHRETWDEKE